MRSASPVLGRIPATLVARIVVSLGLAVAGTAAAPRFDAGAQPAAPPPPAALLYVVGQIDGSPGTLAWHDGALLAALGRTLAAFDVAPDGRATRRIPGAASSSPAFGGPITGLWFDSGRAYVRIAGGPLEIVRLLDRAAWQPVGTVRVRDIRDVLPIGASLWLVDGGNLALYDVHDPRLPVRQGEVDGDIVYTAVGGRDGSVIATGMAVREGPYDPYANAPVVAVTVDNRSGPSPRALGSVTIGSTGYGSHMWTAGIEATGNVATIVAGHSARVGFAGIVVGSDNVLGIQGIDVADPTGPALVRYPSGASGDALWIDGGVAAGPASPTGPARLYARIRRQPRLGGPAPAQSILAVELRNPLSPTLRLTAFQSVPVALAASDDRVFATDISGTLHTLDAPPDAPLALRGADVLVDATGVAVDDDGRIAVVTHHGRGVQVVDVADPTAPRVRHELRTPGGADGANAVAIVRAAGDAPAENVVAALVADGPAGLVVVDGLGRVESGEPNVVARLSATGDARALSVVGDVVYVAGRAGLAVVDVARPLAPTVLGRSSFVGAAHAVAVAAGTAFVVTDDGQVVAVDVRDPTAPAVFGPVIDVPAAHGLAADGDVVYAAAGDGGFILVDARTRAVLGVLPANDRPVAVVVAEGTAYVACANGVLRLADVRDPEAPRWIAAVDLPGVGDRVDEPVPAAVVQAGGRAYVAAHRAGVFIVKAAVGSAIRRAYLPLAMRAFRHTALERIACGEENSVVRQPAVSPDGRWVVCTDGGSLYKASADGGPTARIPLEDIVVNGVDTPVFDVGGSRILFACGAATGHWDLCDVGLEGDDAADLTRGALPEGWDEQRPSPSPNGRYLAFDAADPVSNVPNRPPEASDIYLLDRWTGALRRLTDDPAVDRFPSFFPDGRTILFRSERDGNSELYAVDIDGTGLRRLTNDPAYDAYGTVSPNGRRIAFQSGRSGRDDVYVMDVDVTTGAAGRAEAVTDGLLAYREPRFTADGRALVMRAYDVRADEDYAAADDPNRRHTIVRLPLDARWWPAATAARAGSGAAIRLHLEEVER